MFQKGVTIVNRTLNKGRENGCFSIKKLSLRCGDKATSEKKAAMIHSGCPKGISMRPESERDRSIKTIDEELLKTDGVTSSTLTRQVGEKPPDKAYGMERKNNSPI